MKNYIQIVIFFICTVMFGQEKNTNSINDCTHTHKSFSASINENEKIHDYVCNFENQYYDSIRGLINNDFENNYSIQKKDFSYTIVLNERNLKIRYNSLNNSSSIEGEKVLGKIKKIEREIAVIAK